MSELVSVIIPTYNRAHLITDALDSVFVQNYRPIELIIVDDGSQDATENIVKTWISFHQEKGFMCRYIKQVNQGGNPARNKGIETAKGDFIAFLDSDDCWHQEKTSLQMKRFTGSKVGAVYCGVQEVDTKSNKILEKAPRTYSEGELLDQLLTRDVTAPTSAYIVRKIVFQEVGLFDTKLLARQDWDMWIRIAQWGKIHAVPRALVDYRTHEGERTASNPMKEIRAYRKIRKKYHQLLSQQPSSVQAASNAAYYKRMGRVHFHQEISRKKAFQYYLMAIFCSPADFDNWAALVGFFLPARFRQRLHKTWNSVFGGTSLTIRSH